MPAKLVNSAVATGLEKVSFPSNPKERQCQRCSNYRKMAFIPHTSKVRLKILQARLQKYVNSELPDIKAGFRKGRGTRDQIANIHWIIEKSREFQKNMYFFLLTMPMPVLCRSQKNWKILRDASWPDSWEICMQVKKQQLELNMKQQAGSK